MNAGLMAKCDVFPGAVSLFEDSVRIRQADISKGVARVSVERLVEVFDAGYEILPGQPVQVKTASEV